MISLFGFLLLLLKSVSPLKSLSCFTNLPCYPTLAPDPVTQSQTYLNSYNAFVAKCNKNVASIVDYQLPPLDYVDNMSCQGTLQVSNTALNYNFNSGCGLQETYSAMYSCIQKNQKKYESLVKANEPFVNVILNMPQNKCNSFLGMGTIPSSPSQKETTVWIQSSRIFPNFANTLAHEIGHTQGLQHSGAVGSTWEYSDCSCPMGCSLDASICFNAPNANKLGWAKPMIIKSYNLLKEHFEYYFIPIYASTLYNNYKVEGTNLTFSLRSNIIEKSIDKLMLMNENAVYVPANNAISIHTIQNSRTMFIDAIQPGSIWYGKKWGNIIVKYMAFLPNLNGSVIGFSRSV